MKPLLTKKRIGEQYLWIKVKQINFECVKGTHIFSGINLKYLSEAMLGTYAKDCYVLIPENVFVKDLQDRLCKRQTEVIIGYLQEMLPTEVLHAYDEKINTELSTVVQRIKCQVAPATVTSITISTGYIVTVETVLYTYPTTHRG